MRIAQQKLEALRSQGIDIPALSAEKAAEAPKSRRVIYDNKAKKKKQQQDKAPGAEGDVAAGMLIKVDIVVRYFNQIHFAE